MKAKRDWLGILSVGVPLLLAVLGWGFRMEIKLTQLESAVKVIANGQDAKMKRIIDDVLATKQGRPDQIHVGAVAVDKK